MATAKYRNRGAATSKKRATPRIRAPESPTAASLADVPELPGIEINGTFFRVLEKVSTEMEHARTELMQLHGMLRCLYEVLLYADDDDHLMHADVAQVVARLLNDVVTGLELTRNQIPTDMEMARSVMSEPEKDAQEQLPSMLAVIERSGQLDAKLLEGSNP